MGSSGPLRTAAVLLPWKEYSVATVHCAGWPHRRPGHFGEGECPLQAVLYGNQTSSSIWIRMLGINRKH